MRDDPGKTGPHGPHREGNAWAESVLAQVPVSWLRCGRRKPGGGDSTCKGPVARASYTPCGQHTGKQRTKGEDVTGTARRKRGGGVKIKDGEKVREETSQSPCPGPQGTWQSVFVDTVPTGWQVPER